MKISTPGGKLKLPEWKMPTNSQITSILSGLFAAVTLANRDMPSAIAAGIHVPTYIINVLQAIAALIPIFCRSLNPTNDGLPNTGPGQSTVGTTINDA